MNGDKETTERPTGDLVRQLSEQTSTLIRDEIRLARLEMLDSLGNAKSGAGLYGGAGTAALYGVGAVVAGLVLALALAVPAWAAALIVGAVLLAAAGALARMGRGRFRRAAPPLPREAAAGVRQDIDTVKGGLHK
ncbi:phage holin family protein [Wenjunlia tyrosinilytica]|nr:phage holin family protein [Wenjunlia tyrosinilytica]